MPYDLSHKGAPMGITINHNSSCYTAQAMRHTGQLQVLGRPLERITSSRPTTNASHRWVLWEQPGHGIGINKAAYVADRPGAAVTFAFRASVPSQLLVFPIMSQTYTGGAAEIDLDGKRTYVRVDGYWDNKVHETSVQPLRTNVVLMEGAHNVRFRVLDTTCSPTNVTLFAVVALALLPITDGVWRSSSGFNSGYPSCRAKEPPPTRAPSTSARAAARNRTHPGAPGGRNMSARSIGVAPHAGASGAPGHAVDRAPTAIAPPKPSRLSAFARWF